MRMALILEYDGSQFYGWQFQPNLRTVQGELEKALSHIANHPITTTCAGRTDKGVHAKHQVVHFDTTANRPLHAWILGTNHLLPKDIAIQKAFIAASDFHARFSAKSRSYEYWILNSPARSALYDKKMTWFPRPLDPTLMQKAAQYLLGEHDFSSFRAAECQAQHAIRTLLDIEVVQQDTFIILKLTANAFLHHMVRNIVGVLLPIGLGEKPCEWALEVLQAKDRKQAGITAPAEGLYLCGVGYFVHDKTKS